MVERCRFRFRSGKVCQREEREHCTGQYLHPYEDNAQRCRLVHHPFHRKPKTSKKVRRG